MTPVHTTIIKNLRPGQFFFTPGSCTGWLYDEHGHIWRLHDNVQMPDGHFSRDLTAVVIDESVARAAARQFNSSKIPA